MMRRTMLLAALCATAGFVAQVSAAARAEELEIAIVEEPANAIVEERASVRADEPANASVEAQIPEGYPANYARGPRFKALVWYTEHAEAAHVDFARAGVEFFRKLNYGDGMVLDVATTLAGRNLDEYSVVVMLDGYPSAPAERKAFEQYMEGGGGWMGFHVAAYNDRNTRWPWLVDFLGGGVFYCNNWPPQPVKVDVEGGKMHPVTKNLPATFIAPESEWYQWEPSPRANPDVEVLASISPDNYPLGIKDVVTSGDWPIVWTNRKYRMIYLNTGHNEQSFADATQNLLIINAFRWVVSRDPTGDPFEK